MSLIKKTLAGFAMASIILTSNVLAVSAAENINAVTGHPGFSGPVPANYQPHFPTPGSHPQQIPGHGGINNNGPHNDAAYDNGYREGYNRGYRESYPEGYQQGLRDGEELGYKNGINNGVAKFNEKYVKYRYTQEKLVDLIKKIKFEGRGIVENVEVSSVNNGKPVPGFPGNHGGNSNYSIGYNQGMNKGQYDGRTDGEYEGSKVTYPAAFDRGFVEGTRRADLEAHYDLSGRALTIEDQYAMGFEAFNRGDYSKALFRFNLILVEEPVNGQFRNKAFWYAGLTKMNQKEYETALSIFIIYNVSFPETLKEETTLNIASLLLEVKTGGFIGIGSTRYYEKAKNMLNWWIESYSGSKRLPESYFKLGECYEKMKDTNNAVLTYKKIADNYPDTTMAEDAKKRIKAISSWWPWD